MAAALDVEALRPHAYILLCCPNVISRTPIFLKIPFLCKGGVGLRVADIVGYCSARP